MLPIPRPEPGVIRTGGPAAADHSDGWATDEGRGFAGLGAGGVGVVD